MVYLDVEEYQSTKRYHPKHHCLKDVHVVLDVCFTVSEIKKYIFHLYSEIEVFESINVDYDMNYQSQKIF